MDNLFRDLFLNGFNDLIDRFMDYYRHGFDDL